MKKINILFAVIAFFSTFEISLSQNLEQDSIALVDLYNSTNGAEWHNNTNWLTDEISKWEGITISNDRVTGIKLEYDNLSGPIPTTFSNLSAVEVISFANNNITVIPDPLFLPNLYSFNMMGNRLTFQHIEPNLNIGTVNCNFIYSSQDYVEAPFSDCVAIDTSFTFTFSDIDPLPIHDSFQWRKDGEDIPGATGRTYTINSIKAEDNGRYSCRITNSVVYDLTLYSNLTEIITYNNESADAGSSENICTDTYQLTGNEPLEAGSGSWSSTSPNVIFTAQNEPITSVSGLEVGSNKFTWTIATECHVSKDVVVITRDIPPIKAIAGEDAFVCGNYIMNANSTYFGEGTGSWTVVTPGSVISNKYNPKATVSYLQPGKNTFTWTISNGACTASSDDVIIDYVAAPEAADAGEDADVCNDYTLNASSPSQGADGQWEVISGYAEIEDPTAYNSNIKVHFVGENLIRWTITKGTCPETNDDVILTKLLPPEPPGLVDGFSVCSSTTNLYAELPAKTTGFWTIEMGDSFVTSSLNPNTLVTNLSVGQNIFRWTIDNICQSPVSDTIIITRDQMPALANAGEDAEVCGVYSFNATNNLVNGSTGLWETIVGFADITTPTLYNSTVNIPLGGTNIFRWTVSNGVCQDVSDEIVIVNREPLVKPVLPGGYPVCENTTTISSGMPMIPENGYGSWSHIAGSNEIAESTNYQTDISNLIAGQNIYRWTIDNICNSAVSDTIIITRIENPTIANAGEDTEICGNYQLKANNPTIGTGEWLPVAGVSFDNFNINDANITVPANGTTVLTWTISNGICPSSSSNVTITNISEVDKPKLEDDITLCQDNWPLKASLSDYSNGSWRNINASATIVNQSLAVTSAENLSYGKNIFVWKINNICNIEQTDTIVITRDVEPDIANAGADIEVCVEYDLTANQPTSGIGNWASESGSVIFSNQSLYNSHISGLDVGENKLTWTIRNGVCALTKDDIIVFNYKKTSVANAGTNDEACDEYTLNAEIPAIGTGVWTSKSSDVAFINSVARNTVVKFDQVGTYELTWTISNGQCSPTSDNLTITNRNRLLKPVLDDDYSICETTTTLIADLPANSFGVWKKVNGFGFIVSESNKTTEVTGLNDGENVFVWEIDNVCNMPVYDEITVFKDAEPTIPNAGSNGNACTNFELEGNPVYIGSGFWTNESGDAVIVSPSNYNSEITMINEGNNILRWTTTNGKCSAKFDEVVIRNYVKLTKPILNDDYSVCADNDLLVTSAPPNGQGQWSVVEGLSNLLNPDISSTYVLDLDEGKNTFRWTVDNICNSPVFDEISIFRNLLPTPANAGIDFKSCQSATLHATVPTVGTGVWSVVSENVNIANPTNPETTITNIQEGSNIFKWTVSNECASSSDNIVITGIVPLSKPILEDAEICDDAYVLSASFSDDQLHEWSIISAGDNTLLSNNESYNCNVVGLKTGDNIFRWTIDNECNSPVSEDMTITVVGYPLVDAGEDISTEYAPANPYKLINNTSGINNDSYTYSWSPSINLDNAYAKEPLLNPSYTGIFVLTLTATNELGCSDTDEVTITLTSDGDIRAPTLFTPNNDGANDNFVIFGMYGFPDSELQVFTRWGSLVYQQKPYNNDWDGHPNKGTADPSKVLPNETYFYILKLGEGNEVQKGYVLIRKED